jgi:3-dehydroquinate synthase
MVSHELQVKTKSLTYRVLIEANALSAIGSELRLLFPATRALLISDTKVFSLYGEKVMQSLAKEKWQVTTALIRPGERSKNLACASRLYDSAVAAELDRNAPVIALGGGVVGDMTGFIAATYMRGLPLVMIPTTLLAQVDSSVGGKVAVNHPGGKNLIGAIYPPRFVLIDPLVLNTLSKRQLNAGLVEMIKYGIIEDSSFFAWLEENLDNLLQNDSNYLTSAIYSSLHSKARIVETDEFELDLRRVLNFGHTIGHALEAATGYRYYLHGEAVLAGMFAAIDIAVDSGLLNKVLAVRISKLLKRVPLKKAPAGLTATAVIDKLRQDKKRQDNKIIFVLPTGIGSVAMNAVKDEQLIRKAVENYIKAQADKPG